MHPLSRLECSGLVTPRIPRQAALTLREAEAAGNTPDVHVNQQLLDGLAGGDSLPDVPLPNVPLSEFSVPDVPVPEARPALSVGEE